MCPENICFRWWELKIDVCLENRLDQCSCAWVKWHCGEELPLFRNSGTSVCIYVCWRHCFHFLFVFECCNCSERVLKVGASIIDQNIPLKPWRTQSAADHWLVECFPLLLGIYDGLITHPDIVVYAKVGHYFLMSQFCDCWLSSSIQESVALWTLDAICILHISIYLIYLPAKVSHQHQFASCNFRLCRGPFEAG